jgi:hypothetical protein
MEDDRAYLHGADFDRFLSPAEDAFFQHVASTSTTTMRRSPGTAHHVLPPSTRTATLYRG